MVDTPQGVFERDTAQPAFFIGGPYDGQMRLMCKPIAIIYQVPVIDGPETTENYLSGAPWKIFTYTLRTVRVRNFVTFIYAPEDMIDAQAVGTLFGGYKKS